MPKPKKTKREEYVTVEVIGGQNFMVNTTHHSVEAAEKEVEAERKSSGAVMKIFRRVPQERSGRVKR